MCISMEIISRFMMSAYAEDIVVSKCTNIQSMSGHRCVYSDI